MTIAKNYTFVQVKVKDLHANNVYSLLLSNLKILLYIYYVHLWFRVDFGFLFKHVILKLHSFGTDIVKFKKFTNLRSPFVNKKSREHFEFKMHNFNISFSLLSAAVNSKKFAFNYLSNKFLKYLLNFLFLNRSLMISLTTLLYKRFSKIFFMLFKNKHFFVFFLFLLKARFEKTNQLYNSLIIGPLFVSKNFTFNSDLLYFYFKSFSTFLGRTYNVSAIKTYHNVRISVY